MRLSLFFFLIWSFFSWVGSAWANAQVNEMSLIQLTAHQINEICQPIELLETSFNPWTTCRTDLKGKKIRKILFEIVQQNLQTNSNELTAAESKVILLEQGNSSFDPLVLRAALNELNLSFDSHLILSLKRNFYDSDLILLCTPSQITSSHEQTYSLVEECFFDLLRDFSPESREKTTLRRACASKRNFEKRIDCIKDQKRRLPSN